VGIEEEAEGVSGSTGTDEAAPGLDINRCEPAHFELELLELEELGEYFGVFW
jgi:hypothetical protein